MLGPGNRGAIDDGVVVDPCVAVHPGPPGELVDIAVQFVGTRFEGHVDDAALAAAKLRIVGVGDDLEFLHRIDGRNVGDLRVALRRLVGDAIEHQHRIAFAAAVDVQRAFGLVKGAGPLLAAIPVDAGAQLGQGAGIAAVQRQLGDAGVFHHLTDIGFAFVQQRLGRHGYRLGHRADLHDKVDGGRLIDIEHNVGLALPRKVAGLGADRIEAGLEVGHRVVAGAGRQSGHIRIGALIVDGDRSFWDGRMTGVSDVAGELLAEKRGRKQKNHDSQPACFVVVH